MDPQAFGLSRRSKLILLVFILIAGAALRLYRLQSVPSGLHRDEMSEAYEAYSLLKTGADRWGYRFPVYFLSWGSGQNVLQAYLSIPVIAMTGLTTLGTRFITALFGLLMLPLFFFSMRRWHGDFAAFTALLFLAFCPWHIMLSRWGIENNQLPFFLLLGVLCLDLASESGSTWRISLSLLPFGLALYSYASVMVILPTLLVLLVVIRWQAVRAHWRAWLAALAVFAAASLPFAFFVWKNYVSKRDYAFERFLPVSVPLVPITRLSQAKAELGGQTALAFNLRFLKTGMQGSVSWFSVPGLHPLPRIELALGCVGLVVMLVRFSRRWRQRDPFVPWLVACVPLFFLFALNVSRAIAVYLPIVALAGVGFVALFQLARVRSAKALLILVCAVLFLKPTLHFPRAYFSPAYADQIAEDFHPEMPEALRQVELRAAPGDAVYITDQVKLNYVDTLYYLRIDPRLFQHSGATWQNPDFGPFHFDRSRLDGISKPVVFLLRRDEQPLCGSAQGVIPVGQFIVGRCTS